MKKETYIEEIERLLPKLVPGLKYLRRITGKKDFWSINPLKEKRWSTTCWEHWVNVSDILSCISTGRPSVDTLREASKDLYSESSIFDGWYVKSGFRPSDAQKAEFLAKYTLPKTPWK